MTKVLMSVGRDVHRFFRPGKIDELKSLVDLTIRNGLANEEAVYSAAISDTQAEIVVTGWGSPLLTVKVMEENPQLKYMCHLTGGVRSNVSREVIENGLIVTNWGTLIGPTVAEAALLGMLSSLRRTTQVTFDMHRDGGWKDAETRVESLLYQRVGLHGFGQVARSLVEMLRPFQCEISAYDPYLPDEVFEAHGVKRVGDLKTLYAENYVISIHAPKVDETYHNVNAEVLSGMQDGAVLVNTARGAVIDTEALIAELKTGRIYASLDVYEQEPLAKDSPLRGMMNCHLTYHTAGPTQDRIVDMGDLAVENVRRFINGEAVEHVVTVDQYDRMT
ncbi:MAG: hydroxyacid dehydrogenase [Candidatus Latescibacteria bacterium]|nr:hydroxyacid dehydrogenase [Candidatus Latescibacterota bacterium]